MHRERRFGTLRKSALHRARCSLSWIPSPCSSSKYTASVSSSSAVQRDNAALSDAVNSPVSFMSRATASRRRRGS
jgi:hypothetical protein